MTNLSKRTLFWTPRVASMVFIAFTSLFALDVFGEQGGFWETAGALAIHLIPSAVLVLILAVAWRREWIGTALFGGAGALYVLMTLSRPKLPLAAKVVWCAVIAGPAFIIAALFWLNWQRRSG